MEAITGIAEQTNLLVLNAAIEAARAGEQGRRRGHPFRRGALPLARQAQPADADPVTVTFHHPTDATGLELLDGWLRAKAEARNAYAYWTRQRDGGSYAVYRACADRADAAQDELGNWERWAWVGGHPRRRRGSDARRAARC